MRKPTKIPPLNGWGGDSPGPIRQDSTLQVVPFKAQLGLAGFLTKNLLNNMGFFHTRQAKIKPRVAVG
jgi:hypothetical protein